MFNVATYRKTDKGREEVAKRSLNLSARLRKALIMIDGQTPFGELRTALVTLGDPVEIVEQLTDLGLVESDYDLPPMPVFQVASEDWPDTVQIHSIR